MTDDRQLRQVLGQACDRKRALHAGSIDPDDFAGQPEPTTVKDAISKNSRILAIRPLIFSGSGDTWARQMNRQHQDPDHKRPFDRMHNDVVNLSAGLLRPACQGGEEKAPDHESQHQSHTINRTANRGLKAVLLQQFNESHWDFLVR